MKLYKIVYCTGDGCSWSAEDTIGVFDSYELSVQALEKFVTSSFKDPIQIDIDEWQTEGEDTLEIVEIESNTINAEGLI